MNLIEAIKSGRRVRTDHGCVWMTMDADGFFMWDNGPNQCAGRRPPTKSELQLDTWQIEETSVTITASQFWTALDALLAESGTPCGRNIVQWVGPCGSFTMQDLARRLGLEAT